MSNNRSVLFIDSGIGGLPYCIDFHKKNPQEEVCYLADTQNFPYGPRGKEELSSILINLTEKLVKSINPKLIVLACNTATVSALPQLRMKFPQIPFVGTVPALKPAASVSQNGKVGILGTKRTIDEIRALNLANKTCEIFGIAAPELVEFIEKHFDKAGDNEKTDVVRKYINIFRREGADSLVLGCTHFLYLLDEFRREASPNIVVFDSLEGITKRIDFLLDENNGSLRAEKDFLPSHKLILTSECDDNLWRERALALKYKLLFLNKI